MPPFLRNKYYHNLKSLSRLFSNVTIPEVEAGELPFSSRPLTSNSDILWVKIVSITFAGYEQVYDIEVEGTHNFVAGHWVEREAGSEPRGLSWGRVRRTWLGHAQEDIAGGLGITPADRLSRIHPSQPAIQQPSQRTNDRHLGSNTEWRKVVDLKIGDEIAVANADLFRPDTDVFRLNNEKPAFEFIGGSMLEETYSPMQNFFPGHPFNINYNRPVGFSNVKADNISEVFIKGKQGLSRFKAMAEYFFVTGCFKPFFNSRFNIKSDFSQGIHNIGVDALVGKDIHCLFLGNNFGGFFS